jgi:uncharacterized protein YhaN
MTALETLIAALPADSEARKIANDLADMMAKSEAAQVRIMARLAQLEAELDEIRSELFAAALERTSYGGMQ